MGHFHFRAINPIKPVENDGFAVTEVKNKALECRLLRFSETLISFTYRPKFIFQSTRDFDETGRNGWDGNAHLNKM